MMTMRVAIQALSFSCLFLLAFAQNSCYYAAGKRAGSAIIPCGGSSAFSACCQIGDLCLSDSACWNPQYNVTYLYGCSDPAYADVTCPYKCGTDFDSAPYVGLEYCYNTTTNEWACTHPPSNSDSVQPNPPQQCKDDSIIAFAGPSSLQPILSLPTNVGGSTVYFSEVNPTSYTPVPGYTPSSSPVVTESVPTSAERVSSTSSAKETHSTSHHAASATRRTSSKSATLSSAATTSAAAASSLSDTPHSSQRGTKLAIGFGVTGGILIVVAAIFIIMICRNPRQLYSSVLHNNPFRSQEDHGGDAETTTDVPRAGETSTTPSSTLYNYKRASELMGDLPEPEKLTGSRITHASELDWAQTPSFMPMGEKGGLSEKEESLVHEIGVND